MDGIVLEERQNVVQKTIRNAQNGISWLSAEVEVGVKVTNFIKEAGGSCFRLSIKFFQLVSLSLFDSEW